MTFGMIFKRIWREWRLLLILLFAVSLITGFFALGPLFIRSVTEVDLRYALDNTNEDDLRITLISDTPLTSEEQDIVEDELGALVTGVNRYVRGQYTPPISAANQAPGVAGTALCGYRFLLGVNPFMGVASTPNCYQPFAFQVNDFEQRITVVEGRLPERGPTPAMLDTAGLTDEQQQELQLGLYNRSEIEAVVTREVAEEADLEIGSRFFLGNINLQGEGAVTRLKVVGIVEVNNPNDSFWQGNQMFVQGALIDTSPFTQRYDYGLAVHPAAYEDWITPILPAGVGTSYIWRMDVDTDEITSINAQDYSEAIVALGNRLNQGGRQVQVTTGLISLLGGYDKRIEDAEGPIILLSGAILVLMLYHLITTVSLVLQQQGTEWSTISSRGGSTMQLFKLQSVTILVLVVIAVILSPFLSQGFMRLMESTGPLAQALDGADLSNVTLPSLSIWLSVAAAIACLIVLSVPAIPAARRSLLLLKQATSRPPTTPAWARYWLDLAFVLLGVALMFRLYWTIADEDEGIGQLITNVFTSPRDVVELVADRASQTDGLTDPFNLLAPALVLTGFALLWLRLFPWNMKLI
ncbi:MAG: hypothetical protein GYB66_15555 [Chloroflexi bacterium]|nr:hypothetical protein [Chloroflexota bacterium]